MKPHAKKPPPAKPRLVLVAPEKPAVYNGLTYRLERLAAIARELPAMFERHHAELALDPARAPLDPDWDRYFDYDLLGILGIMTVRDGPVLVGYVFNLVGPHLHKKSTKWCQVDMYWLDPGYRVGWAGYRMLKENERLMKRVGVQKICVAEKAHFKNAFGRQVNLIFKRLGYVPEDVLYGKWIGG